MVAFGDAVFKCDLSCAGSSVPAGITAADPTLSTPAAIESKLKAGIDNVLGTIGSVTVKNFGLLFRVSQDAGATWTRATADIFPTGGITVVIPWQELGLTYEQAQHIRFSVLHMFASSVNGHIPGSTENPAWTVTADGLRLTAGGLSPFAIGYKALPQITFDANGGGTTDTTERTTKTNVVSPNTGDDSDIALWTGLMSASLLALFFAWRHGHKQDRDSRRQ